MRAPAIFLLCLAPLWAQRTLEYDRSVVSQVRIDARDLGYPPVDVIPSGESAIHALAVGPDGLVYGATGGRRSHLFLLNPLHGYVQPLGFLPGVSTMYRSLVVARNGEVYIGGGDAGGHLWKYRPHQDDAKPIRVNAPLEVTDLGVPVPGEAVYCLAVDREREFIYGVSYPNGQFFHYSMRAAKFAVDGKLAEHRIPGEKFEQEKNIGRELGLDLDGNVYASGENGALFRFILPTASLQKLDLTAPTALGREPYNRVDAWTRDADGLLYGGTSDGYLFRLNPKTLKLENLGKPLNQYRIRGLAFARNGKLYGVGGDSDEMARLFSYDPTRGAYEMLGMIDVNRRPYYAWQAYVIDALAAGADGTIYLGESERRSRLYLYYPE